MTNVGLFSFIMTVSSDNGSPLLVTGTEFFDYDSAKGAFEACREAIRPFVSKQGEMIREAATLLRSPTIEEWHAIVDALKHYGYEATLEGGGAACPWIGIQLPFGRYVAFGDNDDMWTGNLYSDYAHGFEGGDIIGNIITDVPTRFVGTNRQHVPGSIADGFHRALVTYLSNDF
jgi:hypothetical protein